MTRLAGTCTGAHGHAGRACDVHRQRADETIPQVQSRPSAGHLVAIGSRESAAHGRRLAPDSMLLRSGPEREIVDHGLGGALVACFGGAENAQNFGLVWKMEARWNGIRQ